MVVDLPADGRLSMKTLEAWGESAHMVNLQPGLICSTVSSNSIVSDM